MAVDAGRRLKVRSASLPVRTCQPNAIAFAILNFSNKPGIADMRFGIKHAASIRSGKRQDPVNIGHIDVNEHAGF